jgi:hypothetical protein
MDDSNGNNLDDKSKIKVKDEFKYLFKEENEAGRITYRGLGMGKLSDDFYKIAGEGGTRIKVKGKEYFITDTEFNTFSRDSSGKMRIRFDAPFRKLR